MSAPRQEPAFEAAEQFEVFLKTPEARNRSAKYPVIMHDSSIYLRFGKQVLVAQIGP